MAEKQETTEALIAEYHADADKMDAHELPQPTTQYLRIMLDRFAAAHKRETATAEKSSAVGDCAKMREALKTVQRYLDGYTVNVPEMRSQVDAALAAPPRNCDRDLSDRRSIWAEFRQWVHAMSCGCATEPSASDAFEWLLAPAAEKEGGEARK